MVDDTTVSGESPTPQESENGDPDTTSENGTQPSGDTGSGAIEEPTEADKFRALRDDLYRRQSGVESKVDQVLGAIATLSSQQTQREDRQPQPEAPSPEELNALFRRDPAAAISYINAQRDQQWEQKLQQSQDQAYERQQTVKGIEAVKGRLLNKHPELADEHSAYFQAVDAVYKERVQLLGSEPTEAAKVFAIDAAAQEVNARLALDRKAQVVASKDRARTASETRTTVPAGTSSAGEVGMPDLTVEEAEVAGKYGGISAEALAIAKTGDREKISEYFRKK